MNRCGLMMLLFIPVFIFSGCNTTKTDLSVNDLHFPQIADGYDRVILLGSVKGRLELMNNCIVLNAGDFKPILLWDSETVVEKAGGVIVISHPRFSTLKVGQKVAISGTHANGYYAPNELPLEPTPVNTCEPTGYLEVYEW